GSMEHASSRCRESLPSWWGGAPSERGRPRWRCGTARRSWTWSPSGCGRVTWCSHWGRATSPGSGRSCCNTWGGEKRGNQEGKRRGDPMAAVAAAEAAGYGRGRAGGLRVACSAVGALAPAGGLGGALVAVDAEGRALPFDPARTGLDLPVAAAADPGVVGVLALVQSVDPALFQTITSARGLARGDVLLDMGPRHVLLRRDAGPEVIRAVVLVAQDLAAKGRPYVELDARFARQVLVRRRASGWAGGAGGAGGARGA